RNGVLDPKPVAGLPEIASGGQGGLLDVVLHPAFSENRLIYFSYAARGKSGRGTEVARARFDGKRLRDVDVIFRTKPKTRSQVHFGSRLLFAPDGLLYITLGDKGDRRQAQLLATHPGSMIRVRDDGSVPKDNPFIGKDRVLPEIFSYGHRNIQGMALHPGTGQIWTHEHGPRGGDELNILKRGVNYGWPKITYGLEYSGGIVSKHSALPGMAQPIIYWIPSIAPSGMAFYSGDKFPQWKGDLFVGALAHRHLRRLELKGDTVVGQEILLKKLGARIRDVRMGPDGYLYVLTDSRRGKLLRLEPS
ncbi:MAG: PQQ-dependent sugar dehydrogenase, partial [Methyloligellaceae bacterium]